MLAPFLPRIPNLELGFLYYFGNNVRTGRFTADYTLPFRLSSDSVLFGEAHAEGWDFWKSPTVSVAAAPGFAVTTSATSNRVNLSFGGGYRTMLGANTLLGVNGFYDTSRLFNKWYSSGGVGLELAANVAGDDAIDLNFNWYGNLFNRDVLVNAFRNKGNSFDVEAGYSHALLNRSLDLRLKLIGYQFDIGTAVQGWRGGADLTTRDGMFTVRYEYGHDPIDGSYNTVGGFVTVGFQMENLLSLASPFTTPEPVFKSPRGLRRLLGLKVKRDWHQPEAVVLARSSCDLRGLVHITTTISTGDVLFTNELPAVFDIRGHPILCWCGLEQAADIVLEFDHGLAQQPGFHPYHMSRGSGCARPQGFSGLPATPLNQAVVISLTPSPINFDPGGGVSLQFQ